MIHGYDFFQLFIGNIPRGCNIFEGSPNLFIPPRGHKISVEKREYSITIRLIPRDIFNALSISFINPRVLTLLHPSLYPRKKSSRVTQ